MENLTKEMFNEIIKQNETFYVICAGGGILRSNECAAYIATTEESAKKYFDSIIEDLPENMKQFSVVTKNGAKDLYDFCEFFNGDSYKYITLLDYGFIVREYFVRTNMENVKQFCEILKDFNENDLIYSVYTKDRRVFCTKEKIKQHFFSSLTKVNEFISQYNNEQLGLYTYGFELDLIANGYVHDMLPCDFDGIDCTGWDIVDAALRIVDANKLSDEETEKIFKTEKLYMLEVADGQDHETTQTDNVIKVKNNIITRMQNLILFTSVEQANKFLNRNRYAINYQVRLVLFENLDSCKNVIANSGAIYINGEKHTLQEDFLVAIGAVKKKRKWNSIEEVKEKAISIWNKSKLYIILALNANLPNNKSIPFVNGQSNSLWIFEELDAAKAFVDMNNFPKIDGKYPIGVIDNSKILFSLNTTLSIANALNVAGVNFNLGEYEQIYFPIKDLYELAGKELTNNFSTIGSEGSEGQNPNVFFNPFSLDIE
jgi:hypothetical protein